jgi:CTP synthase
LDTKYLVITGGVLSGLGKGVAAASIGLLFSDDYNVVPLKLDGYLNADPGTMNPTEHGEVFVLDDGAEVDMDFGHYERFMRTTCTADQNLTMGKVYEAIREKERSGDYLGQTVQLIPHVTDYIKEYVTTVSDDKNADLVIVEVGGTVGDMENELFIEALRQLKGDVGENNVAYAHMTLVPKPTNVKEQKTKPTQQSTKLLNERGVTPDFMLCRCEEWLTSDVVKKISTFTDVPSNEIYSCVDVESIYEIPETFYEQGFHDSLSSKLGLLEPRTDTYQEWQALLQTPREDDITVAIAGKYTDLEDSYASVVESLRHCEFKHGVDISIDWVETTGGVHGETLGGVDALIVPGGFGKRGIEGKIDVIGQARRQNIPFLGICYGLQLAVVEFARNVCDYKNAHTTEVDEATPHPVVSLLDEQEDVEKKGGTMRLGGYDAELEPGTVIHSLYNDRLRDGVVRERHRHRYEVNPAYEEELIANGLVVSGRMPERGLVEFIELPEEHHPYFVGTQAHPELTSRLDDVAPLFAGLVEAAKLS